MHILYSILGIALILLVAFLLSSDRKAIRLRVVGAAFALQAGFAALVLYVPWGKAALEGAAAGVDMLISYARDGVNFVFGPLAKPEIGGASFAIGALPAIIFFAALISVLYYLGVMQLIIKWIGGALEKVTGITKVESLGAAANIFVGQSESPLVIRPYIAALTPSQLFCMMSVGMAGVAGTILALYASMGISTVYLVAAAFMSAPGGILMAKIIMPDPRGEQRVEPDEVAIGSFEEEEPANIIMAAAQGAQTGVKLAVAVGAMVLAFVALVALANGMLSGVGNWIGLPGLTFDRLVGYVFAPVFYLIGNPDWSEALRAGGFFGSKVVLNEVVGFQGLTTTGAGLSERMVAVVTFALCGFANFSSIAIQMAVTGGLAPSQRPMIAKLGIKALAAGSLSNLMSAALAGLFIGA
ncbi:NupC/NupG family nucleoside CNT transporter [Novosphingobium sp. TH158]|uniref:NupC/NupG family nucleoside CNT transporter n=1 Tax=Novosphingobium sp. TH158 TaxID=2067455 RepID=UPI000C79F364|nr:NupC/NupG family nucleoside CNT transporter [Novosphingobium sp. TH158]PLK27511.1 NupC/NupG family nucleoside CNT transporter [Novosphingobium sp. TH158]